MYQLGFHGCTGQRKYFVQLGKLPRMMIPELRLLAGWMSRHPLDSHKLKKIVFIINLFFSFVALEVDLLV